MTEKELRKLNRRDLLEMLIFQTKRNDELEMKLHEAEEKLNEKNIFLEKAGSIAQAALQLSGVFEAADEAALRYLASLKNGPEEAATDPEELFNSIRNDKTAARELSAGIVYVSGENSGYFKSTAENTEADVKSTEPYTLPETKPEEKKTEESIPVRPDTPEERKTAEIYYGSLMSKAEEFGSRFFDTAAAELSEALGDIENYLRMLSGNSAENFLAKAKELSSELLPGDISAESHAKEYIAKLSDEFDVTVADFIKYIEMLSSNKFSETKDKLLAGARSEWNEAVNSAKQELPADGDADAAADAEADVKTDKEADLGFYNTEFDL